MKPTLKKVKIIFKSNIDYFVNSALVWALVYSVAYLFIEYIFDDKGIAKNIHGYSLPQSIVVLATLLIFAIPVVIYFLLRTSQSLNGISLKPTDATKAKRFLFLNAGMLWIGTAVIAVGVILKLDYMVIAGIIASLVSWAAIHRTIGAYAVL